MDRSSIVLTAEQQLLVENSLEFVHWTIAKLIPKSSCHMEYDDLFQEGCVALCHAAASYHGGTSFKTYAITVIRNHLIDCCRKQTNWRKYISEQSLDDRDGIGLERCAAMVACRCMAERNAPLLKEIVIFHTAVAFGNKICNRPVDKFKAVFYEQLLFSGQHDAASIHFVSPSFVRSEILCRAI